MSLRCRVFGPGLPATGVDGMLDAATLALAVEAAPPPAHATPPAAPAVVPQAVDLPSLRLAHSGFGRPGLALYWRDAVGEWQLHLDADTAAALLRAGSLSGHPALAAWRKASRRLDAGRGLGWAALGVVVLAPLLLVALAWWQADRLVDFAVRRLPASVDAQLGQAAFDTLRPTLKLQPADSRASKAVAGLVARLAGRSDTRWRTHVADDPEPNAFALPGGIVVVNTGLLEATRRPEELAGVLAHEIEHVEQRHGVKQAVRSAGWQAVLSVLAGDVPGADVARELGTLAFSRDAEREADERGLERLVARDVDPRGLPDFFATLARVQEGRAPPAFLSTHPDSGDRAARLRQKIDALGTRRWTPLPVEGGWPP